MSSRPPIRHPQERRAEAPEEISPGGDAATGEVARVGGLADSSLDTPRA